MNSNIGRFQIVLATKPRFLTRGFSLRKSAPTTLANGLTATELTNKVTRLDLGNNVVNGNRKAFRGPLKCAILDWSGTTADAHVIAPAVAFVEVFKKHGVPISMKEARVPMGLRKDLHIGKILEMPEVKKRWTQIKKSPPNAQTVQELFKDFVPMQLAVLPRYSPLWL